MSRTRKQKILKDRPQQRRGRDALRLGVQNPQQIRRRKALPPRLPQAIRLLRARRQPLERQPRARSLVNEKQQAGLRRHGHLRVIAGGFQLPIALQQRGVQLIGALQRRAQHRRAHAVNLAAAGIQHQQPLRGKNPGNKTPQRPGPRCAPAGRPRPAPPWPRNRPAAPAPASTSGVIESSSTMPPTGRAASGAAA